MYYKTEYYQWFAKNELYLYMSTRDYIGQGGVGVESGT